MSKYTRKEKESFLIDVIGYDQGYLEDLSTQEIDELCQASPEFEGYMS